MTAILLATRNRHKAGEIARMLGPAVRLLTLNDFPGAPCVAEDADTFAGNARKKTASLAAWLVDRNPPALQKLFDQPLTLWVLADDSGLEVDALQGAPGVHSARFAAMDVGSGNSPDSANNAKLLRLLENVPSPKRTARFRCVLALARMTYSTLTHRLGPFMAQRIITVEGVCEGRIAKEGAGRGGFGYDPLFIPDGHDQSFAELGEEIKNSLSHRARALAQLKRHL